MPKAKEVSWATLKKNHQEDWAHTILCHSHKYTLSAFLEQKNANLAMVFVVWKELFVPRCIRVQPNIKDVPNLVEIEYVRPLRWHHPIPVQSALSCFFFQFQKGKTLREYLGLVNRVKVGRNGVIRGRESVCIILLSNSYII